MDWGRPNAGALIVPGAECSAVMLGVPPTTSDRIEPVFPGEMEHAHHPRIPHGKEES